jgi:hypothetical protein
MDIEKLVGIEKCVAIIDKGSFGRCKLNDRSSVRLDAKLITGTIS